jgi:hypothetical protein
MTPRGDEKKTTPPPTWALDDMIGKSSPPHCGTRCMKKVFRETIYMRSPAGNKSPAPRARRTEAPSRLPEAAAMRKSPPHTDPEPRYTGIGAGALPRAPRTHHTRVVHAIHGRAGAPLSRGRTPKATRRDEAARLAEATEPRIVHLIARRTRDWRMPWVGRRCCACHCMPGQCRHKAGWQTQHPSPSMNAVSCSRMCCAALNPCRGRYLTYPRR